jgi:ABC-type sugar transport system ATPase subunit
LAVRPEATTLLDAGSPQSAWASKVIRLEPLGNELLVHLQGPTGGGWVARADPERRFAVDQAIGVGLDPQRLHLFAGDTGVRLEAESA